MEMRWNTVDGSRSPPKEIDRSDKLKLNSWIRSPQRYSTEPQVVVSSRPAEKEETEAIPNQEVISNLPQFTQPWLKKHVIMRTYPVTLSDRTTLRIVSQWMTIYRAPDNNCDDSGGPWLTIIFSFEYWMGCMKSLTSFFTLLDVI